MRIYETYNCDIADSDLVKYGLHGGHTIRDCQRCEQLVCEAHSIIIRDLYDRLILCSRCSALAVR